MHIPAGDPFYIDLEGEIHILEAGSTDSLMSLNEITPEEDMQWNWRMVKGVFESADNPDFSDARTIHTVIFTIIPQKRKEGFSLSWIIIFFITNNGFTANFMHTHNHS